MVLVAVTARLPQARSAFEVPRVHPALEGIMYLERIYFEGNTDPKRSVMSRDQDQRLRNLVLTQGDFVARSLRNLGVWGGELDDCVQKVFLVAARRLTEIEHGKERAFLFACAQHTAAHFRRSLARKREVPEDAILERSDPELLPDQLAERKRHREILDQILETMDENVRSTFVLYSFEEMTMVEIAQVLDVPQGTVASRLRRAREIFKQEMTRRSLLDQGKTTQESA